MNHWTENDIPDNWTGSLRMADGRWASKCRACGLIMYATGTYPPPHYSHMGRHEYDVHKLNVVGINVAMLALSTTSSPGRLRTRLRASQPSPAHSSCSASSTRPHTGAQDVTAST